MITTVKNGNLFKNSDFLGPDQITIVGVGSVGSAFLNNIMRLGIPGAGVRIWDSDSVSEHNLSNQILYGVDDFGKKKVYCAQNEISEKLGATVDAMPVNAGKGPLRSKVVVSAVDSMETREHIFNKCVYLNGYTRLFIDMRMTAKTVMVFAVNPMDEQHVKEYRDTLYSDSDVKSEAGSCGITPSIGATAQMAASIATWLFIQWSNQELKINEILFSCDQWAMHSRKFD